MSSTAANGNGDVSLMSLLVQPFPPTGATYPISKGPAIHATWAPDGKELLYSPAPAQIASVSVTTQPTFTFGNPVLTPTTFIDLGPSSERNNDVTHDGRQFLGVIATSETLSPHIQVVLNWSEELKRLVPTK